MKIKGVSTSQVPLESTRGVATSMKYRNKPETNQDNGESNSQSLSYKSIKNCFFFSEDMKITSNVAEIIYKKMISNTDKNNILEPFEDCKLNVR